MKIRPIALGVVWNRGRLLAYRGLDRVKKRPFFRPLGGTIEFGERGSDAVVREFREEIRADLVDVRYLGTIENLFTYGGRRMHEIALIYEGRFADATLYRRREISGEEGDGEPIRAFWVPLTTRRLYPDGLAPLLRAAAPPRRRRSRS